VGFAGYFWRALHASDCDLQDTSKTFPQNLKQGLKAAFRGRKTSMADSAATMETVESSAPSVDSVASDLPSPTFSQVTTFKCCFAQHQDLDVG
jgi:hypothetical protein